MAKAPYIEEGRLRHLLKVAAISGESPLRNVALLTTVYGTGMMLTEIARLSVRAYLNRDGSIRVKSCVDARIAYNGRRLLASKASSAPKCTNPQHRNHKGGKAPNG